MNKKIKKYNSEKDGRKISRVSYIFTIIIMVGIIFCKICYHFFEEHGNIWDFGVIIFIFGLFILNVFTFWLAVWLRKLWEIAARRKFKIMYTIVVFFNLTFF